MSWRSLKEDFFSIKTSCLPRSTTSYLQRLEDFKTSRRRFEDVMKMSWSRLEDILKTSWNMRNCYDLDKSFLNLNKDNNNNNNNNNNL